MMARRRVADAQMAYQGGLNLSADASQLLPNQVRRAENCRLTVFGGLLKRLGSRNLHAAAIGSGNPVRGGFAWQKDDASQQLLALANGLISYGSYSSAITWATATTAVSTSAYPSFAAFRDGSQEVVYVADGGKLLKWNGTTLVRSTVTGNVARVWVYNQRLYGCTGLDAILLASGLNNGDELGVVSGEGVQAPIRTFGESSIVGGVALGVSNLIFHRSGISRWTGVTQDDIAIQAGTLGVSPDVGTIVPQSIVATETEAYFLSDRGFYAVNAYGVRRISPTLDPDILELFTTAANLCAVHNRYYREVCWYLPNVGFYAYNYQMQAWVGPWNGGYISPITHSCWPGVNGSSTPIVMVGTADGFVKQMDYPLILKDNVLSAGTGGTNVTMTAQLRRFFYGNPASEKAMRFLYVLASLDNSQNAAIAWNTVVDSGSQTITQVSGVIWDTPEMEWDSGWVWGGADAQEYRVQQGGRGPFEDIVFTDSSGIALPLLSGVRADAFDYGDAHAYE